ncbi:MAG: SCP2 sterol-binding domain-containing protein, partial [Pseudomonadota bacterium]
MGAPSLMTAVLEDAINRLLRLDPDTLARLGEFDGKCIGLRLAGDDRDLEFFLFPSAAGFRVRATHDTAPDVTIRGDVPVFTRLVFGGSPTTRAGELQISGDIDLGQDFQRILRALDIDWEERTAHVVGDVAAHQFGRVARGLRAWARQSGETLRQDVREYLQEESRLLAKRESVDRFLGAVDTLRADADR